MKKELLSIVLLLLSFTTAYPQLTVSNLKDECQTENIFPSVESANPVVKEKINTLLQAELLEIVPGSYKRCAFEKVIQDTANCCSYVSFYEYQVTTNTKTIFSLAMSGETMGAYPENASWEYNFNAATGDVIFPEEIFTQVGYDRLKQKITADRRKKVNDFLKELNNSLKTHLTPDDKEMAEDQKNMYENCLEYIDGNDFLYGSFLIKNDKIIFMRERCSNHAMRAIDDLDEFNDEFLVKDIYNDLNSYGKALFSGDVEALKKTVPPVKNSKLLKGTLNNKIPITCIFTKPNEDGSLTIYYWYDNHKTMIEWTGKLINDKQLQLAEKDYDVKLEKWIDRALIEAEVTSNSIIGVWKDQKTGKVLPLKLSAF